MGSDVTKKLGKLNLMDRFLFDSTMENRDAYQAMVSILLEREVAASAGSEKITQIHNDR